jgi:hypothetical protein
MISSCIVDQARLNVLRECMGKHLFPENPPREYEWNVISNRAVVYSCGMISRADENLVHCHDENELEQCQRLASAVASIMLDERMVDDEGDHGFAPFYITVNETDNVAEQITEDLIRSFFGRLIYPSAEILIEPLEEGTNWWDMIDDCAGGMGEESASEYLALWRGVIDWFAQQQEIHSPVFVSIGREAIRGEDGGGSGCVLPRLAVGLSRKGSLVGMFTCVTHS